VGHYNNATSGGGDNHSQVLLAKSTDGGATFSAPVKVGRLQRSMPDCAGLPGRRRRGRACVPEKGATAASIFRASNYPYGAVDPRVPGHCRRVTYGSYINRNSNEANGCTPAGVSATTGGDLYTGGQDAGGLPQTRSSCRRRRTAVPRSPAAARTCAPSPWPREHGRFSAPFLNQYFQGMRFAPDGTLVVGSFDRRLRHR